MPSCQKQYKNKSKKSKRHNKYQKGGSPASELVMSNTTITRPMNDYVVSPRIRDAGYDDSLGALEPNCMKGGSLSSDLVMEQLNSMENNKSLNTNWESVKGDMNSLKLYQTTGGSHHHKHGKKHNKKSSKRHSKSKKSSKRHSKSRKSKKSMRGGGSDWIMSQYSLGPSNNPEMPASMVGQFSQSMATSRSEYMNPLSLGSAGSGYPMSSLEGANVKHIGAPLS